MFYDYKWSSIILTLKQFYLFPPSILFKVAYQSMKYVHVQNCLNLKQGCCCRVGENETKYLQMYLKAHKLNHWHNV